MKKNIASVIAITIFSLFIGFSSTVVAKTETSATSGDDQIVVTLPEVICTAEKMKLQSETSYREYLNGVVESIRESMERIELKNITKEVKAIIDNISK